MAFGHVKGRYDFATRQVIQQYGIEHTDEGKAKLAEATRAAESVEPDHVDKQLSVAIDVKLKKTLCYIIMNRKFDYEIYKTPTEAHGEFMSKVKEKPFEEPKSPRSPEVQDPRDAKRGVMPCFDCCCHNCFPTMEALTQHCIQEQWSWKHIAIGSHPVGTPHTYER